VIEPSPDSAVRRPFRLNGDGAERQGRGEGCEGLRADRDLDHAGDMGASRAGRQNSPRAWEVSNAGANAHFAGAGSKPRRLELGGPPG
jgi:hypothetical protein